MISKKLLLILNLFLISFISTVNSQNTVGTILHTSDSFEAYTLFTLFTETYLINNCGEVINQWSSSYPPGNAVYLLENGNLLRAGRTESSDIIMGGAGGRIELYNWNGDLIWGIDYDTPNHRQHHDVFPMPNGNILILAATVLTQQEAIQAGRDPNNMTESTLYNEQIIEIEPIGLDSYNILWEWNLIDHVIQDFDVSKENYGVVNLNPQLLDINFINGQSGGANWIHANSIQYDETLDQIIFNSRNLSELYIIDHSTTTSEASSHSAGLYGKGGDFLYRWGNPQAYKQGSENDRKLYGQHYPHWINEGFVDSRKIILFNNGNGRLPAFSEVFIINPPMDSPGVYTLNSGSNYGPLNPDYIYTNSNDFYSAILSSAQRLSNGNTLICEGRTGELIEIDQNENIVWKYTTPVNNINGTILSQGDSTLGGSNNTFRAIKYAPDYPAFTGKDLTPGNPIELNSHLNEECSVLSINDNIYSNTQLYPNPVENRLNIDSNTSIYKLEIYNLLGNKLKSNYNSNSIDLSSLAPGVYLTRISFDSNTITKRIIKK
jgi:hypothetical protein